MKGKYLIVGVLIVAAAAFFLVSFRGGAQYANDALHVSFEYPESYDLTERKEGDRTIVVLIHENETAVPEGGEGPPAMTLDVSPIGDSKLVNWITQNPASNFQISDPAGVMIAKTVGGMSGFAYTWDGLYRGRSVAVERGGNVYLFSVTFRNLDDPITRDFDKLLESVRFD